MKCLEQSVRLSLSFLISLIIFSFSFANVEIVLKKVVYVENKKVKLGDIAYINADNENFEKYISSLIIRELITSKDKITKNDVINTLKKNYVDLKEVNIKGNYSIVILKKTKIDKNYLTSKIKDYMYKKYKNIEVEKISLPNITIEVIGKPKIKIIPKGTTKSYMYFDIFIKNYKTSASIKYYKTQPVVVAKRYISKGSKITIDDIKIDKVKVSNDERYFTNTKNLIGKKVRFSIKKGEPITLKKLEKEYYVIRNTNVEVVYSKNGFKIKLLGRALQNGELGDLIKVRNTSSGKVILCKVIGKNKVEFIAGQR